MISPPEIARTAHRLGVGDRTIEKDYVLSWLLVAIVLAHREQDRARKTRTSSACSESRARGFHTGGE